MIKPTFLDRLISRISPRAGYNRMRYRAMNTAVFGSPVSRKGAELGGKSTLGNWLVRRISRMEEARERETLLDRAEDLLANEPLAATAAETMGTNIVGSGLIPQADLDAEALGISEDASEKIGEQMDAAFDLWSKNAGLVPGTTFADLQYLTIMQMMGAGEFINLGRMLKKPGPERLFSFCLQPVDSLRMGTPPGQENESGLHDGVKLDKDGVPQGYHLADPPRWNQAGKGFVAEDYKYFTRMRGHRHQVLHGFRLTRSDQYRGTSPLAAGMKGFRDLSDYLDHELVAAMVASTMTILLETPNPTAGPMGPVANLQPTSDNPKVQPLEPGGIWTAPKGYKPTVPEIKRPNANFPTFLNTWVTILASMLGMPREIIFKDFTETTFSSARAALNEAWRTFMMWRTWLENHYCAPIWQMVIEEAFLLGMIDLPKGAPGFYQARHLWCAADWQGPGRGTIDPEKEQAGYQLALDNYNTTYTDNAREQGRRFKRLIKRREKEAALMLGLLARPAAPEQQEAA